MNQDLSVLSDGELNAICAVEVMDIPRVVASDYCNSTAAFWQVVEKMKYRGYRITYRDFSDGCCRAEFTCPFGPCKRHGTTEHTHHGASHDDKTPGRAIVIAAITAVRKEKQA